MEISNSLPPKNKIFQLMPSRQFLFYSFIGMSGVGLDMLVYWLLVNHAEWNYLSANILSTSLGISNNFILNALLNFKVKDRLLRRFLSFFGIGLLGMLLTMGLLWVQVDLMGFSPVLAKFVAVVVIVVLQYKLNKRLSFARAAKYSI